MSSASSADLRRSVSVGGLAVIAFFITAAGPYGIENAVGSAGPLLVILATLLMPFVWAVPIGLMTAEMASMMSHNGGYILWVEHAFGPLVGFVNGWNAIARNTIDLSVYPRLAGNYIDEYLRGDGAGGAISGAGLSQEARLGTGALIIVVSTAFNLLGLEVVDTVSAVMAIGVTLPFVVLPAILLSRGTFTLRPAFASPPDEVDWPTFMNTVVWAWMGWDGLGCIAGEVDQPERSYPKGIVIAAFANAVFYALPVATGVIIVPQLADWDSGTFVEVASSIEPWMGVVVLVSAIVSNTGICQASMASYSRALWAAGGAVPEEVPVPMAPRVFGRTWRRYGTPWVAILSCAVSSLLLMNLQFTSLVALDVFFTCLALALEVAAFAWLRWSRPDEPRPFRMPGGWWGVVAVATPALGVVCLTLALATWETWAMAACYEVVLVALYFVRRRLGWDVPTPHAHFHAAAPRKQQRARASGATTDDDTESDDDGDGDGDGNGDGNDDDDDEAGEGSAGTDASAVRAGSRAGQSSSPAAVRVRVREREPGGSVRATATEGTRLLAGQGT